MTGYSKIIITGAFRFPDQDAAAARVLALGKALRESGHEVVFCGWEENPRALDLDSNRIARYQGFEYFSQAEFRREKLNPLRRFWSYLNAGRNTLKWLRENEDGKIGAIISYHGRSLFLLRLMRFCSKKRIRLFFDCTEWYGAGQLVGGRFGFDALDNALRMKVINPLIGQGLVISRYLHEYYSTRGTRTLRLPPMVDMDDGKWPHAATPAPESRGLSLIYAGTPGKKDLLGNILQGIAKGRRFGLNVSLSILGPDEDAIRKLLGEESSVLDELAGNVRFQGQVPQSAVPTTLGEADFSVLIRRNDRHSNAGFPTKVVESLAAGVPIICNHTSDLNLFIQDKREGLIAAGSTSDDFAAALQRATSLTLSERSAMRANAYARATEAFDYRQFVAELNSFIGV